MINYGLDDQDPITDKISCSWPSRRALVSTQPHSQWVGLLTAFCPAVKEPEREANYSPIYSAEDKNSWSYTSTSPYVAIVWCLLKHRGTFIIWRNYLFWPVVKFCVFVLMNLWITHEAVNWSWPDYTWCVPNDNQHSLNIKIPWYWYACRRN
jgi:hypothetical protein